MTEHTPGLRAYLSCGCIAHIMRTSETEYLATSVELCPMHAAAPELLEALEEIAKGKGAFSRDPVQHASNTIQHMKDVAQATLAKAQPTQSR